MAGWEGGEPAWISGTDELDHRHEQQRGVETVRLVVPDEAILPWVPALVHNLFVDGTSLANPNCFLGG
jgi:hypothetical protein